MFKVSLILHTSGWHAYSRMWISFKSFHACAHAHTRSCVFDNTMFIVITLIHNSHFTSKIKGSFCKKYQKHWWEVKSERNMHLKHFLFSQNNKTCGALTNFDRIFSASIIIEYWWWSKNKMQVLFTSTWSNMVCFCSDP